MILTKYPYYPWETVGPDLSHWKGIEYLLVVDYFSRYIEIAKLTKTTSVAIIERLKSIFARHGIAKTLISDNGPQYSASGFAEFAKLYDINHKTSSPNYPQELEKQKEL